MDNSLHNGTAQAGVRQLEIPRPMSAAAMITMLAGQAEALRRELATVREQWAQLKAVEERQRAELVEANELLILATLDSQTLAENATSQLDELARTSQRDELTDTPNRALMLDRLGNAMAMARRHGTCMAVLFIDLDGFKQINDTLGHAVGDEVLRLVARRLEAGARESDTVSRHGGDEFLVLLTDIPDAATATALANNLLEALLEPARIGELDINLSASIGVAVYPEDGDDAATLIRRADIAMYEAKHAWRDSDPAETVQVRRPRTSSDAGDTFAPSEIQGNRVVGTPAAGSRLMREVNEELVVAALAAQEVHEQAVEQQRLQARIVSPAVRAVRTPQVPIRMETDVIVDRGDTQARSPKPSRVIITDQVAQLARLVDDLLEKSCVGPGTLQLQCDRVDIHTVLAAAVRSCRPALEEKVQTLAQALPSQPVHVQGDAARLIQVFSALLENASRYTPVKGRISLVAEVSGPELRIVVTDNGIGIMAMALPLIFEMFVQERRDADRNSDEHGSELALVRDVIGAHGGTVTGNSAGRNLGSEFVVTLPVYP